MRELFEICQEIEFLTFWCFLSFEGVNLVRKGVKQCVRDNLEKFPA